jgi:ribosomal protein RSM22 (predicted rRNA methylase)
MPLCSCCPGTPMGYANIMDARSYVLRREGAKRQQLEELGFVEGQVGGQGAGVLVCWCAAWEAWCSAAADEHAASRPGVHGTWHHARPSCCCCCCCQWPTCAHFNPLTAHQAILGCSSLQARDINMDAKFKRAGAHVVAPCPHDGTCPMSGTKSWCHFGQRFHRPRFMQVGGGSAAQAVRQQALANLEAWRHLYASVSKCLLVVGHGTCGCWQDVCCSCWLNMHSMGMQQVLGGL